jgi:hypothetical protein
MSQNRTRRIDQILPLLFCARRWLTGFGGQSAGMGERCRRPGIGEERAGRCGCAGAFPGTQTMRSLKQFVESEDAASTAALVRRISETILVVGDPSEALELTPEEAEREVPGLVPDRPG